MAEESACCGTTQRFEGVSRRYKQALWAVIAINGSMFVVEMAAGMQAGSQALKADALDFLGDTLTYGLSLLVIGMALTWRARAALVKGVTLGLLALWVLGSTMHRVLVLGVPDELVMGVVGVLACLANLLSVAILLRFREGDANVRSVWVCSRNDAIGNLAVVAAAFLVGATATAWPDLVVATGMAGLFLQSAVRIIQQARAELAEARGEMGAIRS